MRFLHPHGESAFLCAQPRKRRGASQPSEMAYCGHASERRSLKRSLEPAAARAMSLGRGKSPQVGTCPLDTHDAPFFFAVGAVFFRRSRLFFREAAFSSGGEGCEWRAQRATVGESGDKAENSFQTLSHSPSHDRALALTSPPPDFLFISIHPKPLTHPK